MLFFSLKSIGFHTKPQQQQQKNDNLINFRFLFAKFGAKDKHVYSGHLTNNNKKEEEDGLVLFYMVS